MRCCPSMDWGTRILPPWWTQTAPSGSCRGSGMAGSHTAGCRWSHPQPTCQPPDHSLQIERCMEHFEIINCCMVPYKMQFLEIHTVLNLCIYHFSYFVLIYRIYVSNFELSNCHAQTSQKSRYEKSTSRPEPASRWVYRIMTGWHFSLHWRVNPVVYGYIHRGVLLSF